MKDFKPVTTENAQRKHTVFAGLCKGCRICQEVCPQKCIGLDPKVRGVYNNMIVKCDIDKCTSCGICQLKCPDTAIKVEKKNLVK